MVGQGAVAIGAGTARVQGNLLYAVPEYTAKIRRERQIAFVRHDGRVPVAFFRGLAQVFGFVSVTGLAAGFFCMMAFALD